ncbi:acetylornithine deacetylase [Chelativorans sp.]|uniref:acetylornithine deacetylase n=1 Tax=Chelativorans sp. TaxID=2203393 RepID=UPI00281181BA|nr:acetylornithine deacetylase [Chelativorans sp.]
MAGLSAAEILERLVAFDSTSRNSNLDIIAFIEDYLASHGVASRRYDYEPGRKTNLFATIGPEDRHGVLLSGHTDVVPVDGQEWTSDPFRLTARDGRLHGRGTCDMKGFLAAVLAMVPTFRGTRLETPIHLAFSCDEEIGCRGVRPMVEGIVRDDPLPLLAIVGEPTSMEVINAHKGTVTFRTEVVGAAAHSSNPQAGANATYAAAEIVLEIERIAEDLRSNGPSDAAFATPYSTLQVGVINGGTVKNIVPERCGFIWEMRPLPGVTEDEVLARVDAFSRLIGDRLQGRAPQAGISTTRVNSVPGLAPQPGSPAETFVLRLAGRNRPFAVSYATEGGHFSNAGIPTLICGPGSIDQAHKPDEFIEMAELDRCLAMLSRLARECERPLQAFLEGDTAG